MPDVSSAAGVVFRVPDSLDVADVAARRAAPPPGGRRRAAPAAAPEANPLLEALAADGVDVVGEYEVTARAVPPGRRRAVRGAGGPAQVEVEVAEGERAAVLVEQDGVQSWVFASSEAAAPAAVRRLRAAPVARRLVFDLDLVPSAAPPARRGRTGRRAPGPLVDAVVGAVKAWVFRWAVRAAVGGVVAVLERNKRSGLVRMDSLDVAEWKARPDLAPGDLPGGGGPVRVLLFVHGTFSSTTGSYGALCAEDWGKALLTDARAAYDLVVGFDHRTLSDTPLENAKDLLRRLEDGFAGREVVLDAVAYSRGALVLRSFVEQVLPASGLAVKPRVAVFVAGTNAGTALASAGNWKRLADLTTNLATAAGKALTRLAQPKAALIVRESLSALGTLLRVLAEEGIEERAVPGLAAMAPESDFVRDLNGAQAGQPAAADWDCRAVRSEFDVRWVADGKPGSTLPARVARWALDGLADGFMREPNDLVVNLASMASIDAAGGEGHVREIHDFGRNPEVYHTVYFTRRETADAIRRWLGIRGPQAAAAGPRRSPPGGGGGSATSARRRVRPAPRRSARPGAGRGMGIAGGAALESVRGPRAPSDDDTVEIVRAVEEALPAASVHVAANGGGPSRGPSRGGPKASAIRVPPAAAPETAGATDDSGGKEAAAPAPAPAPPRAPRAKTGTLHVAAQMPTPVQAGKEADLLVTLSRKAIEVAVGRSSGKTVVKIDYSRKLVVQVVGVRNVEVVGDRDVTLDPGEIAGETIVPFRVRATDVGAGEVWVLVRQGPVSLAKIVLRPEITAGRPAATAPLAADAAASEVPVVGAPYPLLQVFERTNGAEVRYEFNLVQADGTAVSAVSEPLRGDRTAYVAGIYAEIERRWVGCKADADLFEQEIREYGAELFDELVPPAVAHRLWKLRNGLRAIHVVSGEPFIPWEIVHLRVPKPADGGRRAGVEVGHFLAEKGLTRWLHNVDLLHGLRVRKGHAWYVIPDYTEPQWKLPEAQDEIPGLKKLLGAAPITAHSQDVRAALDAEGNVDLFHFSGHGVEESMDGGAAKGANPLSARILLLGGRAGNPPQYVEEHLTATAVGAGGPLGAEDARPLVFLNACQVGRPNWKLTNIGGFAAAFLSRGAAAFVGTLWSVGDAPAKHFGTGFYGALVAGKTLAEAAAAGRAASRGAGEATWLAYTVYGYPHSTLSRK